MINRILNNTIPLCFSSNNRLVAYRNGTILILEGKKIVEVHRLFCNWKEKYLWYFNFLNRLLRFGIRAAEMAEDDRIIFNINNVIFEYSFSKKELSKGFIIDLGIRPLAFTKVSGVKAFDDTLYFGGYLHNPERKPVNIYKRIDIDTWEIVYTFPQGTINHVHTIVSDPYRQCLWIFTGDFDESAAIWKVTDNFKCVEWVVCNDQKYRGCVVFALPEGLLYATDAPFAKNHLYLMNTRTYKLIDLKNIDGSCIYGCRWKDNYVFSTTVEPDGRNSTLWKAFTSRKRGAGIKDDYVHMYCGDYENGFEEIYKEKKDRLPYAAFQFGVFKFPYGVNNTDTLYFQPIGTQINDLKLLTCKQNY